MSTPPSYNWIHEWLQGQLSADEMKQIQPYILKETWLSPSVLNRHWQNDSQEIPTRFQLNIDMKV
ncbi:hypothetical protein IC620_13295 [Hazenella sp. IB182357]|uniref:Uncharacterized protein n=1 Tax=Polycladospora coralii TaxID=2771432 RepID=A0A926NHA6_9BACL|nr:hypothetical protein [Polycladospora coralii]MBD1373323.1 hypothetical protein [Polycladospora coralii]MBS7528936.1 hypothetical protein [Polycladospora coralii]